MLHIYYALQKGYTPMVDFKGRRHMCFQSKGTDYKEINIWERYFKQPSSEWTLEDVYKSKNVIISDRCFFDLPRMSGVEFPQLGQMMPLSDDILHMWHTLSRKYIRLSDECERYIDVLRKEVFPKGKRILGLNYRAGYEIIRYLDWPEEQLKLHHKQADVAEFISDIHKYMDLWDCEYAFLSIDDSETRDLIIQAVGKKILHIDRPLLTNFHEGKPVQFIGNKPDSIYYSEYGGESKYHQAMEQVSMQYIAEIVLLSECTCLLASNNGGSRQACIMNGGKYNHIKIYDKGMADKVR